MGSNIHTDSLGQVITEVNSGRALLNQYEYYWKYM